MSQHAWLAMFYAAYFGFVGLYSPFLGPYLKTLGHSLDVIALSLGMMQLMRIVGPFAWGWLSDHTANRVRWIRAGAFGGFLCSVLVFLNQQSAMALVLLILLLNLNISGLVPMSDTHCMEICRGDNGWYGKIRLFGSLGFVAAVLLFGWIANVWGYASYPFLACLSLLIAFGAAMQFSPAPSEPLSTALTGSASGGLNRTSVGTGFRQLLIPQPMPTLWLASFFMILAHGVFYAYFSLYLLEHHYTELTVGWLWAFGVLCEVAFFALQTRFFDWLSLSTWLCIGYAACAVRFAVTALFPDWLWMMVFAQGLHALTFAAHHTATIAWLRVHLPGRLVVRGQAMYATIAYGLGGSAGTVVGRSLWGWGGPSTAFGAASLAGLIALFYGLKLKRQEAVLQ
ncbi:MFS transporter [Limnobacter humi]|uniref:MFS transporter n=1 Tax=Limnobacter humi TaxID=1778671 RepID=A0ABT1WG20_9BURK|nr:MFS transporter [Limnobacter humi]MCQ8895853.1 MFS transporter [Limnobacter humi]